MSPPCLGQQVRRARGSRGIMGLSLPLKARTAQNRRATGRLKRNRCGRSTYGTIRLSLGKYSRHGASLSLAFLAAFGSFMNCFSRKKNCSPAVKTNSALQSTHFKTLSAISMCFSRRHLKSQSVAFGFPPLGILGYRNDFVCALR